MVGVAAMVVLGVSSRHEVAFAYRNAQVKSVQIAGDFNAWSSPFPMSKSGDQWTRTFSLPDDGRVEYKLIVDGNWIVDPGNPVHLPNGVGGDNSVWQGPRYRGVNTPTPKKPYTRSTLTVGGRTIVIFGPERTEGLPILVYGDGPTYENPGRVQDFVAALAETGRIKPTVIVLIPPIDRTKEYGDDWKAYGRYVFQDVLPAVRQATGASRRSEDLFMGGSSMGGVISLRLAEEYPDQLAGGIQCQSTALQWTSLTHGYAELAQPNHLARLAKGLRIWLDWGTFEDTLTKANEQLSATLKRMNRPFGSLTTHEGHNWTAWRDRMAPGLRYVLDVESNA